MTYNIWGYYGDWDRRKDLIIDLLTTEQPDIVGLQEVLDQPPFNRPGEHQGIFLARAAAYPYVAFQIAHRTPQKIQGNAVLSRIPFEGTEALYFYKDETDPKDTEDRVALLVSFTSPAGEWDLVVTHLSLSRPARVRSVERLAQWLIERHRPFIVMGDLNDTPESAPLRYLLREGPIKMVDGWAVIHPKQTGFTFPSHQPQMRIDYALFYPADRFIVQDAYLKGDQASHDGLYPSDHLAIIIVVEFKG
ncbi:MAG: endonuclease/exonuclease/phosphatase family protein [Armatimonadota bacterium]|nr:endonuclease/exonuclease/phosphatase family protein [Armatimonadota bacterium]